MLDQDFGAKGDGNTDDTAAIKYASCMGILTHNSHRSLATLSQVVIVVATDVLRQREHLVERR
jgi:hypothetical protein